MFYAINSGLKIPELINIHEHLSQARNINITSFKLRHIHLPAALHQLLNLNCVIVLSLLQILEFLVEKGQVHPCTLKVRSQLILPVFHFATFLLEFSDDFFYVFDCLRVVRALRLDLVNLHEFGDHLSIDLINFDGVLLQILNDELQNTL